MKFNFKQREKDTRITEGLIGDVFPVRKTGKGTAYFLVVAIHGEILNNTSVICLDIDGNIIGAQRINSTSLLDRPRLGFVENLSQLEFEVVPV